MVKRILCTAAVVTAVALALLAAAQPKPLLEDPNAVPRPSETLFDPVAAGEALQADTQASSRRFRLSATPAVTGREADLLLSNPAENGQSVLVSITLDATGETIYESAPIVPGGQILRDSLLVELPAGEHSATATFRPLSMETGAAEGEALQFALTLIAEEAEPPSVQSP